MPKTAEATVPKTAADPSLTSGNLQASIWRLALPSMAASLVQICFDLTHAFWVGRLGPIATAGLSGGSFLSWILFSLTLMLNTGISALIARRLGEGDEGEAVATARGGLLLAAGLSLPIAALAWLWIPPVLAWMGLEPAAATQAWAFLKVVILTYPLMWAYSLLQSIFAGRGQTRASFRMVSLALILNMALDPLLIHGLGMGIAGAATAAALARGIGIAIGAWLLLREGWVKFGGSLPKVDDLTALARKALRIGLPHAASSAIFCCVFIALSPIVTRFGSPALAAWGISQRLETVVYSVLTGLSVACSTLVGQNLGAGQPDRAERLVWLAGGQAAAFCACFSAIFWFAAPALMPLFTPDPTTQAHGVAYLRTIGLSLVPYSAELVFEGAFAGAGNTLPPMLIITFGTLLRIPMAWLFAFKLGLGAQGVWLAVACSMGLKGSLLVLWFKRGSWKHIKV